MEMFIFGLIVGTVLAWLTVYVMLKTVITKVNDEMGKILDQAVEAAEEASSKIEILARVELHGDTFYAYNKETNEFMAQGRTLKEIKEHMFKRYDKDKYNVVADPHNDADVLEKLKATTQEAAE